MTKGKVDQSTEESLTGHTFLKSISFKGKFRAQIYTCKMWVVWESLPVKVISSKTNKAITHFSSINLSHKNYVYIEQYQKKKECVF